MSEWISVEDRIPAAHEKVVFLMSEIERYDLNGEHTAVYQETFYRTPAAHEKVVSTITMKSRNTASSCSQRQSEPKPE